MASGTLSCKTKVNRTKIHILQDFYPRALNMIFCYKRNITRAPLAVRNFELNF